MSNTPCSNPKLCGVKSHRPGTQALCQQNRAGGGRTAAASPLGAAPRPASASTPSPEQPTLTEVMMELDDSDVDLSETNITFNFDKSAFDVDTEMTDDDVKRWDDDWKQFQRRNRSIATGDMEESTHLRMVAHWITSESGGETGHGYEHNGKRRMTARFMESGQIAPFLKKLQNK